MTPRFCSIAACAALCLLSIAVTPSSAQVVRQITDLDADAVIQFPVLDDAGTAVFMNANADPLGVNPDRLFQLMRFDAVTGAPSYVTLFEDGVTDRPRGGVSVSDDGVWLAFISNGNLSGENNDRSDELFVIRTDGTQLDQLTDDSRPNAASVLEVCLSGDASRVYFLSETDPLGTNPNFERQLFGVDRDGNNLVQMTSGGSPADLSTNDDGSRVVFVSSSDPFGTNADGNPEVFAIDGNGSNLRQLTQTIDGENARSRISGNGVTVVYQSTADPFGTNDDGMFEIFAVEWDGTGNRQLTDSTIPGPRTTQTYAIDPSIDDNATTVYFTSPQEFEVGSINIDARPEIWRIDADGSNIALITDEELVFSYFPAVSGDGSRLVYTRCEEFFCNDDGTVPAQGVELVSLPTAGGNRTPLLPIEHKNIFNADIAPLGDLIAFISDDDPLGGQNPLGRQQLFTVRPDGSEQTQVTQFDENESFQELSIAENGRLAWVGTTDDDGGPFFRRHVFSMMADGSGLLRLNPTSDGTASEPVISKDGSTVLFVHSGNIGSLNLDGGWEIFKINSDGTGLVQLTNYTDLSLRTWSPRVDASGTWATFLSSANLAGGNADGSIEVFRIRTDGAFLSMLTSDPSSGGIARSPDISEDGATISMALNIDPGNNPDHGFDLYTWDPVNSLTQRTSMDGNVYSTRISADGAYAYFTSDGSFFEVDSDQPVHAYRMTLADGTIERIDGLSFAQAIDPSTLGPFSDFLPPSNPNRPEAMTLELSSDGKKLVAEAWADPTGDNPDRLPEIVFIDLDEAPEIRISAGAAPTRFDWEVEAGPIRYDAVRGDVTSLASGVPGETLLGPVVCLADDKPTPGAEDTEIPAVGQVFFYVYRGSAGLNAGSGSYGQSSNGAERTATSGDCNP